MNRAAIVTPMLALYRSDESSYQPEGLPHAEDGDPQASLGNLEILKKRQLVIQDIWVRKGLSRALLQFSTGEQYLALGLADPANLAAVAAEAGYGEYEELKDFFGVLPPDYDDKLPSTIDAMTGHTRL